MGSKTRMIVAIACGLVVAIAVTVGVVIKGLGNSAAAASRTEADFTLAKFEIGEIWEMQKKRGKRVNESYIFIKPRREDFNLRFPESDFFGKQDNKQHVLTRLQSGDPITVKVLKTQLAEARKAGAWMWLVRFVQGEKREVTIYELKSYDEVVSRYPINAYDAVDRDFVDRLTRMAVIFGMLLIVVVMAVKGVRKRRLANAH